MLTDAERATLEQLTNRRNTALRARIVLACADRSAPTNGEVTARLKVHQATVGKWRRRFAADRLDGLFDEGQPGAPGPVTDDRVERVVVKTLEEQPRDATHWSRRSMAKATGMSPTTIGRIWRAFELKPHLAENVKLSTDPLFIEKASDVVGLYLDPPERAVVVCVDEKTQIQALNRSQPILPLMPATVRWSSRSSSKSSTPRSPTASRYSWSWTTTGPARRQPSNAGCRLIAASTSTSCRPAPG